MTKPTIAPVRNAQQELQSTQDEITRLETEIRELSAKREALVESGGNDAVTIDELSRLTSRITLAESRLAKARIKSSEAHERLSEVTYDVGEAVIRWLLERESAAFQKFCESLAPYFDKGEDNRAFRGDAQIAPSNCWARKVWPDTDAFKHSLQRRINLSACSRQHGGKCPLSRAGVLERAFLDGID